MAKPEKPKSGRPKDAELDDPVKIPLDFETALKGLLAVDPESDPGETATDSANTPDDQ